MRTLFFALAFLAAIFSAPAHSADPDPSTLRVLTGAELYHLVVGCTLGMKTADSMSRESNQTFYKDGIVTIEVAFATKLGRGQWKITGNRMITTWDLGGSRSWRARTDDRGRYFHVETGHEFWIVSCAPRAGTWPALRWSGFYPQSLPHHLQFIK